MKTINFPIKAKIKATAIHLGISLLIFAVVVSWLIWVLYPSFYFNMSGGIQGLGLMFGVDVVLGPLLTFLVFNPHKPLREIVSDCVIIGLVQIGALSYGLYTVYQEHPKLVILYEYGTATALTKREVAADKTWSAVNSQRSTDLAGVPLTVFYRQNYIKPQNASAELLQKADRLAREAMSPTEIGQLKILERQHGGVYVFAVMGKYTGAFIVLDREFKYLDKIGEKEVGL